MWQCSPLPRLTAAIPQFFLDFLKHFHRFRGLCGGAVRPIAPPQDCISIDLQRFPEKFSLFSKPMWRGNAPHCPAKRLHLHWFFKCFPGFQGQCGEAMRPLPRNHPPPAACRPPPPPAAADRSWHQNRWKSNEFIAFAFFLEWGRGGGWHQNH